MKVGYVRTSKEDQNPEVQRRDYEAARARGRRGGRKPAMDDKEIALTSKLMRNRDTPVSDVCETICVSVATLYRYLTPDGNPKATS